MRKGLIALMIMVALVLVACAQGPASTPETAATPEVATTPETVATPEVEATPEITEAPFSVTVTDGLGNEVTLNAKPMRIVSMTLATDEILLDLVGPERLAGITYLASDASLSNIADRPELAQIPNVVQPNPGPEQIIAMEPDLVLVAAFTDAAVIEQLKQAGLPVFVMGFVSSIDSIKESILTIGELVGEPEKAQEMVDAMDARLDEITIAIGGVEGEPPTVLYLSSDGWVAGAGTSLDDIIIRAGGVNAAADLVDWNQVSEEQIIQMNPDVVILSPFVTDEEFIDNPVFADLAAIQNGRVYVANDAHMSAASQYIVLGVEDMAQLLYPEAVLEP
jgi:iron complex transport system substrate-binding protein